MSLKTWRKARAELRPFVMAPRGAFASTRMVARRWCLAGVLATHVVVSNTVALEDTRVAWPPRPLGDECCEAPLEWKPGHPPLARQLGPIVRIAGQTHVVATAFCHSPYLAYQPAAASSCTDPKTEVRRSIARQQLREEGSIERCR